jgi:microfibrillar-associated protein 1
MTDAEIMKEDKNSKLAPKERKKMKFMQKYYHKGAFFRTFDEKDEIQNKWDFTQPTLEDKGDKTILPTVMQVKNFGKSGRTKYTHLVDQDTTSKDMLWFQNEKLKQKYKEKLGGVGAINDDRSKKRKV